jgi:hypothetical protein
VNLKIFSPKHLAKILAFFTQTIANFCKKVIITLGFEKNSKFFAENWRKSQNIVIITSTPAAANELGKLGCFGENERLLQMGKRDWLKRFSNSISCVCTKS